MGIKVVLTTVPYSNHVYTPPIQLAYLKGFLQQDEDIEVQTLDAEVFCFKSPLINFSAELYWEKVWDSDRKPFTEVDIEHRQLLEQIAEMILARKPDVVGFSVTSENLFFTRYVSGNIKKINPAIYIIYGGLKFSRRDKWQYHTVELHRCFPEVDCVVKNEGEITLSEIVKILKAGKSPQVCRGATIRLGEQIVDGGLRPLTEDIDSIPLPDFADFRREDYLSDYIRILFWRGCIGQCVFCGENYTMGTIRYRSARNIVDEIKLRINQGYKRFQSCDLCLNPSVRRLAEVCHLIIKEGLNIEFVFSQFRHSPDLTPEMFRLLYQAGFRAAIFGTESGSQLILNKMRKGVRVETVERNIRDAHNQGIKVILNFMTGFPGETQDTFSETMKLVERNKDYIDAMGQANPTAINMFTGFYDNLQGYDLDINTVLKFPIRWQSRDGKNCYEWRSALAEKLMIYATDIGILPVDYRMDGNPKILLLDGK